MFTKVIHILMSLVLLISTTGLTVDKHYCGNNLVSVSFFGHARSCGDMDGSCCHQDTKTFKLTSDYTYPVINLSFDQDTDEIPVQVPAYVSIPRSSVLNIHPFGLSPPLSPLNTLAALQTYRL